MKRISWKDQGASAELEALYNPHVDFGFVDDTACRLAKAILE